MQYLNNNVLAKIISIADVPIDTYLAFKNIGAIPKKLNIISVNEHSLQNMFSPELYP